MTARVVVFDYGSGNLRSASRALERVGAVVDVTSSVPEAAEAEGLVVPGVGAFAACMSALAAAGGDRVVRRRVERGRPVLGICVGHQVLFSQGEEHGVDTAGLGLWPGSVTAVVAPVLPHVGWNTVAAPEGSAMFADVGGERLYFVHSYAAHAAPPRSTAGAGGAPAVAWASYGGDTFVAAVEDGPLWSTQFHPEKSGDAGLALLAAWLTTL